MARHRDVSRPAIDDDDCINRASLRDIEDARARERIAIRDSPVGSESVRSQANSTET
jgi:hypothetical protein